VNARKAFACATLTAVLLLHAAGVIAPVQAAEAPGAALSAIPAPLASAPPSDDTAPPPVAHNGDLTHLVFTARDGLVATLIAPVAGGVVGTPVTKVVVQTIEGAGVEVSIGGAVVPATQLGERAVDGAAHTARYTYYGVPFKAGPNDVVVTALGADGMRGAAVHYRIDGAGKPVAVRATLTGRLVADGRTPATLTIAAVDALGHSAQAGTQVIVSVHSGDVRLALPGDDRSPGTNAVKLSLNADGKATVLVLPGATSGTIALDVIAGEAKTTAGAFVAPFLRHAIVTGLVSGGLGATPGDEDGDGNVDGGSSRRGRIALTASGEAFDRVSLTFAYDTARRLAPSAGSGPFVVDPADRPNQTYGDASTQRDDAVSTARLYARVEDGHDAFTYGQFNADLGGGDASATSYHQVLDGARLQLADSGERAHATLFDARNDVAYARQTFAVSGLAALATLQPNIVPGSDAVTLVALDRRTGAPVSQTVLQPNIDYVLDDAVGSLRFIQVPLPFDAALDPQVVVVQYQYTGGATQSRTTGGSASLRLGPATSAPTLRAGYVNDVSGAGNFSIFEQALSGTLHGGAWSLVHADAAGFAGTGAGVFTSGTGATTHFTLADTSRALRLTLGYDATSAGYQNPFGGFATPGLTDLRAVLAHPLHGGGELSLSFDGQANRGLGNDTSQSQAALDWKQSYGRLKAHGGLGVRRQNEPATPSILPTPAPDGSIPTLGTGSLVASGPAVASTATQATAGLDYALGPKSTLSLARIQDLAGSANADLTQPSQTIAGIDLAVDATTHAYLRSTWSAAPQIGFAESTAAATSESGTRVTTFGIDRNVGPNTTVTTQWALQDTGSASDVYATNGVRERLQFSNALKGDAFFQTSQDTGATGGGEFSVYGASLAYLRGGFHASSAFQNRSGVAPGFDLQLGAGGALGGGLSLLGHLDDAVTAGLHDIDARVGLAWRPERDDRGASLLELERQTGNLTDGQELADTVAFDEAYRPGGRLEIDGRLAYKLDGDTYYAAHSELAGLRVDQRIASIYDLAVETRTLRVPGIAGAVQTGLAAEAGVRLGNTLRVAAGYAFSGAADPSLFAAPTRRGAYVTATSVVDRIFGWGR
jgi:hypothetical protein